MKINCECGHTIHDSSDALSHKAHLIPDKRWNDIWDKIDDAIEHSGQGAKAKEDACMKLRYEVCPRIIYQCSVCSRLYINDAKNNLHVFFPENTIESKGLLDAT